jgi:hypothetical protein
MLIMRFYINVNIWFILLTMTLETDEIFTCNNFGKQYQLSRLLSNDFGFVSHINTGLLY